MASSSSTVKFESKQVIDRFLANVDVWQAIFEMLEVKDRIRLEMTNKRLRILMLEYWKRVASFDVKCPTEMSDNPSMNERRWAAFIDICVNRIGDGLRSLTIPGRSTYPVRSWSPNLRSIGEGCPNVERINFIFGDNYGDGNGTLDIGFDSLSCLKTFTVSPAKGYIISASASLFLSIPVSVEVIRGLTGKREEPFENAAQMEGFFADRPSLREVCLANLYTRDESKGDIFRVIAERCPHLKSIKLSGSSNCINYSSVLALESMTELRIRDVSIDEMEIVKICERSPLVEALEFPFRFSSDLDLQSTALNALGSLTKLRDLCFRTAYGEMVAPSLATEFVRELAQNSGASLRRLDFPRKMPLPTGAIEALANGCPKLRHVEFLVRVGEATPASIRFLVDCIIAHPSCIPQTDEWTLVLIIGVMRDSGDEAEAGRAAFEALAEPAANLPSGVHLYIWRSMG